MAAPPYAFVTLLTSDSYLPGALAQAAALRDVHSNTIPFHTVCIVTPETVDVSTIKLLRRAFSVVIGVETIGQDNDKYLQLLGRPDLHAVLTKLHVFRLTQYSKVVYLDADVLPIRPLSHLFQLTHEFSAVPDVGWPDIFNSGVMVLSPGEDKFEAVSSLLKSKGSWDGGDQGILNEWRGGDWNRLSFTYNTTPTAAYTYAPAYERYGSQISAVHFIGPNKPWHSITSRAPGTKSSQKSSDSSPQQAYDYDSLVDRWFAVYDKHYRSHPVVPREEFEVQKYVSAWDNQKDVGLESPALPAVSTGAALTLEDLKRLAVEGVSKAGLVPDSSGEGGYHSMPLEGRIDLMPPRNEKELKEQAPMTPVRTSTARLLDETPPRMETLSTPRPDEIPPTPHLQSLSLPAASKPSTPKPAELPTTHLPSPSPPAATAPPPIPTPPPAQNEPPKRPASPPLLSWNPAIEPPPTSTPAPSAFPGDTYFQNAWDQKHTEDVSHQQKSPTLPDSLFQPPPPTEIPEQLLRQGHYRNVTGEDNIGSPSPDRTKVKPMFPWETRPRHLPGRIFPGTETPPSGSLFIQTPTASPSRQGQIPSATPSPLVGMPMNFSYANAWDTVPSIQKYASRFVKSSPRPQPLQPAFEGTGRGQLDSYRSWAERTVPSGRDSEDENQDDIGNGLDEGQTWDDETPGNGQKKRVRSVSVSSGYIMKRGTKEYKGRGIQTPAKEMRNQGVQVTPTLLRAARDRNTLHQRSMTDTGGKRLWQPATGSNVLPPVIATEGFMLDPEQMAAISPVIGRSSISFAARADGARSPREFSRSQEHSPTQSPEEREQLTTPPQKSVIQKTPGPAQQLYSEDSPVSSIGPTSPEDGQPLMSSRKGGRVWDPARGVELFKRGSEEVLARFWKMGSWEEDADAHQH